MATSIEVMDVGRRSRKGLLRWDGLSWVADTREVARILEHNTGPYTPKDEDWGARLLAGWNSSRVILRLEGQATVTRAWSEKLHPRHGNGRFKRKGLRLGGIVIRGGWSEGAHPRDSKGRFAPKGHGRGHRGDVELSAYDEWSMEEMSGDPWDVAEHAGLYISSDKNVGTVALVGGQIVGATFESESIGYGSFSFDVAVLPEFQGQGIGGKLLDSALATYEGWRWDFPDLELEVDIVNPAIGQMLERRGFELRSTTGLQTLTPPDEG